MSCSWPNPQRKRHAKSCLADGQAASAAAFQPIGVAPTEGRLRAAFEEGWEPSKVKNLINQSLLSTVYRACKDWQGLSGQGEFVERLDLVRRMVFMAIEQGWKAGFGPSEKSHWMCCGEEICWGEVEFCGTVPAPL